MVVNHTGNPCYRSGKLLVMFLTQFRYRNIVRSLNKVIFTSRSHEIDGDSISGKSGQISIHETFTGPVRIR